MPVNIQQMRNYLQSVKGQGKWKRIADGAGVDYSTIARIAQGRVGGTVATYERIQAAITALDKEPA